MGNLLMNIRFGAWHWQIARDWPWLRISRNDYHDKARRHEPGWSWFEIY